MMREQDALARGIVVLRYWINLAHWMDCEARCRIGLGPSDLSIYMSIEITAVLMC